MNLICYFGETGERHPVLKIISPFQTSFSWQLGVSRKGLSLGRKCCISRPTPTSGLRVVFCVEVVIRRPHFSIRRSFGADERECEGVSLPHDRMSIPVVRARLCVVFVAALLLLAHAGRDFYDILGVPRDADDRVLKKEYRRLVKLYHPDKKKGFEKKFKDISDAYEVLGDRQKRAIYDQYGEEGLKNSADGAGAGAGASAGFQGFPGGMGGSGFKMEFNGGSFENLFNFGGGGFGSGGFGGFHGGGGHQQHQHQRRKQRTQRNRVCLKSKICEDEKCYMIEECKD
jgi:DnaJ domain